MNFKLTLEDYTIILNALHYYNKSLDLDTIDRVNLRIRSNFDEDCVNTLRDKLLKQYRDGIADSL